MQVTDSFRKKAEANARKSLNGITIDTVLQPEQKAEIPTGAGMHFIKFPVTNLMF